MKYRVLLALLFLSTGLLAQEFTLTGVVELENDRTAISYPRYDLNDELCAAVFVELSSMENISFSGAIVGDVDKRNDTYLLYLPDGAKRFKLMHEDYLPMTVDFSQHNLKIKGGHTYRVLISVSKPVTQDNTYGTGAQYLVFKSSVPLTRVEVNGENWPVEEGKAKKMVPLGKYAYKAYAGEVVSSGTVEVKSTAMSRVVNVKFE